MLEPVARNTAPALTVAALAQLATGHDPLLLMLPSDHLIGDTTAFHQALAAGIDLARDEFIVTFGIEATRAATGYGYIRRGAEITISAPANAFHVAAFTEKPAAAQAEEYISSGRYFWNSGIFMVRASVWLATIERLQPAMYRTCAAACRDGEQDVRQLVEALAARERQELEQRLLVQRPWGAYEVLESGDTHQVKRLTILPGRKISLQLHRRRSEHWVVVTGTATVSRGEEVFDLAVNESTFIPAGVNHRLENRAALELEIIEVQVGDYLGEDDIVRFDDEDS